MTPPQNHQTNGRKRRTLNVLRLYRKGKSKQEIAKLFGMTVQGVAALIRRAGVLD